MNFVDIAGTRRRAVSAELELYHLDSDEADWNLVVDGPAPPR